MSTKCSEDEMSCRMSTTATSWSRSRCSSAILSSSRAVSPSGGEERSIADINLGVLIIGGGLGVLVEGLTIEADDAVSSRLLRHVQRVVSSFHEGITVFDSRMRPCRHAAAHRALQGPAVENERVSLYCFTRAFREGNGRIEHRPRQQEHKLFSTITTDAVNFPPLLFQDARDLV